MSDEGDKDLDKEAGTSSEVESTDVVQIRPSMDSVNIKAKVVEAKAFTSGSYKSTECILADATACIVVLARSEHVEQLKKGRVVEVAGARVEVQRGSMRLNLQRGATVSEAADQKLQVKDTFNMSLLEFEEVHIKEPS